MLFVFSDRNALITLVRGDNIIRKFKAADLEFKAELEKISREDRLNGKRVSNKTRQVQIYNPNLSRSFDEIGQDELAHVGGGQFIR